MERDYQKILRDTETRVLASMTVQNTDKDSPVYGAFTDDRGMIDPKYTVYRVTSMISLWLCEDSRFYHDGKLYARIISGLDFALRSQHADGLFDYINCNFHSSPDTGFIVKRLLPALFYLSGVSDSGELPEVSGLNKGHIPEAAVNRDMLPEEKEMLSRIGMIVRRAANGIAGGGFHTPNHRWAIASTLMECWRLYGDPSFKNRAEEYLAEGIDCNEDGEYAEKSAGNYNRVNNDAMINLSEATGDKHYEEYAVRNLRMMDHYWEPDGSVFTANSTRFDKDMLSFPTDYYTEFMLMGTRHDIPQFLAECSRIIDICEEKGLTAPDCLIDFLRYPDWRGREVTCECESGDYLSFYRNSGIVRIRRGRYTCTIMRGKSNFLYFHNGTIKLEMKVAGSFCEHRAFKAETMEPVFDEKNEIKGFALHQTMRGWYYLPWKKEDMPDTSDWWAMDNASRDKLHGPDLHIDTTVELDPEGTGILVNVKTHMDESMFPEEKDPDSVFRGGPFRIEIGVTGAKLLETEHLAMELSGNEALTVKSGICAFSNSTDTLEVGPAFGEHHYMEGKEDSELRNADASTVYFTAYTGFDRTIRITDVLSRLGKKDI